MKNFKGVETNINCKKAAKAATKICLATFCDATYYLDEVKRVAIEKSLTAIFEGSLYSIYFASKNEAIRVLTQILCKMPFTRMNKAAFAALVANNMLSQCFTADGKQFLGYKYRVYGEVNEWDWLYEIPYNEERDTYL